MIAAVALALAVWQGPAQPDSFSHARHRRLFTSCQPCHAGIYSTSPEGHFPTADLCRNCHDGTTVRVISWTPLGSRPTNVRFDHRDHEQRSQVRGDSLTCRTCHAIADTTAGYMAVGRARGETCVGCHAHRATGHLVQARCARCHVPLTEATGLPAQVIATFPKPPTHDSQYVYVHGLDAGSGTCRVCHAREFCASCHVNAAQLPDIAALAPDARVAALVQGRRPWYPVPATHRAGDFMRSHGPLAAAAGSTCGSCHARQSCLTCHRDQERLRAVAALPRRQEGGAPGVDLSGRRPPDHVPGFAQAHRVSAAGGDGACSQCHTARYCASCHDAASSPRFHPPDFVSRHSVQAYNQEGECAACHQTQAFCQDCHRQTGLLRTNAPLGNRFHTTNGYWLFGHSAAARRSLESCASCHQQTFCMQCHSARGGWSVSPHGPGFDPDLGNKNPAMCRACHISGPPSR